MFWHLHLTWCSLCSTGLSTLGVLIYHNVMQRAFQVGLLGRGCGETENAFFWHRAQTDLQNKLPFPLKIASYLLKVDVKLVTVYFSAFPKLLRDGKPSNMDCSPKSLFTECQFRMVSSHKA